MIPKRDTHHAILHTLNGIDSHINVHIFVFKNIDTEDQGSRTGIIDRK